MKREGKDGWTWVEKPWPEDGWWVWEGPSMADFKIHRYTQAERMTWQRVECTGCGATLTKLGEFLHPRLGLRWFVQGADGAETKHRSLRVARAVEQKRSNGMRKREHRKCQRPAMFMFPV